MNRTMRIVFLLALLGLFITACEPEITSIANTCRVVTIEYIAHYDPSDENPDEMFYYGFHIYRVSDDVLAGETFSPAIPNDAAYTAVIYLDQTYPDGTEFYLLNSFDGDYETDPHDQHSCILVLEEEENDDDDIVQDLWQDDGRLNWFRGFGDRIVLYTVGYGANGIGLHIYNVEDDSEGRLLLQITPDMINGTPPGPENTLILETRDIYNVLVSVYRLSTGELQINYGPDHEGKVFVYILDPSTLNVLDNYHTFNVYDILGD